MKKIFLTAVILFGLFSCDNLQPQQVSITNTSEKNLPVPADIYTADKLSWVGSPAWTSSYVALQPELLFENGNIEETKIIKALLSKDNRFQFTIYKKAVAGKSAEWSTVTGTFELQKKTKGCSILTTHAIKGSSGSQENIQDKIIDKAALASVYSNSYLCEKICFNGIASADFLLLVNIDEHPGIEKDIPVQSSWVSKFYIK